jgi:hypothetical protein
VTLTTEAELVQNPALGAMVLWAFTAEFYGQTQRQRGPVLPLVLPVLPMVLHEETVSSIHNRHFDGGLFHALADNRTLTLDVQERMEAMREQTMRALNVGFATNLLTYERQTSELRPKRMTPPVRRLQPEVARMMSAAARLGYWFCTINAEQICSYLRIRF